MPNSARARRRAWPRRRAGITLASLVLSVGLAANAVSVMDRVYAELDHGQALVEYYEALATLEALIGEPLSAD